MMPTSPRTFYICSPLLDQSIVVARLLRKHQPHAHLVGVFMPDESSVARPSIYHAFAPLDALMNTDSQGIWIPTGAQSTHYFLQRGHIQLGECRLDREMLCFFEKFSILQAVEPIVPTPTTWQTPQAITAYPVFYKQAFEQGGGSRGIAHTPQEIPKAGQDTMLFQEYIAGKGTYGVAFLADAGNITASQVHYECESYPKEGGSAVVIEQHHDERLVAYTQSILKLFGYSGWGLAEFKYCPRRKDYVFMEINAKLWASCEFTFRHEPQFLQSLLGLALPARPTKRMVFIERALRRGVWFTLGHLPIWAAQGVAWANYHKLGIALRRFLSSRFKRSA